MNILMIYGYLILIKLNGNKYKVKVLHLNHVMDIQQI